MAQLVNRGAGCTEFSRCVEGYVGEEEVLMEKARERTTMDEACDTPDDRTYLEHKDDNAIL